MIIETMPTRKNPDAPAKRRPAATKPRTRSPKLALKDDPHPGLLIYTGPIPAHAERGSVEDYLRQTQR